MGIITKQDKANKIRDSLDEVLKLVMELEEEDYKVYIHYMTNDTPDRIIKTLISKTLKL